MPAIIPALPANRPLGYRLIGAVAVLLLSFAVAPAAHAQWEVHDAEANTTLTNIKSDTNDIHSDTTDINKVLGTTGDGGNQTMNANMDAINKKLRIGTYDAEKPGPRVVDPDQALPAASTAGAKLDNGSQCTKVASAQQTTCQQIVAIENAQYKYMLTMYENTNTRDAMLRKLLEERKSISADDPQQYGKLEDNTNKLTALYNLIALDQQQMQTVNYAYDANLRYLRAYQARLAHGAETGQPPDSAGGITLPGIGAVDLTSAISALATGGMLKLALKSAQSSTPSGMKTLSIGQSNGW